MARGFGMDNDRIRGSSNIPLSSDGEAQAELLGRQFAARGGLAGIFSSPMVRARQTAERLASTTGAPVHIVDGLRPWNLGGFEGQPSHAVMPAVNDFMTRRADEPVPGRGPASTASGESFNTFRQRFFSTLRSLLGTVEARPNDPIIAITHFRNVKLLQAWDKAGQPPDGAVDEREMMRRDGGPGSVVRLAPGRDRWHLTEEPMTANRPLQPGLYVVRHGLTAWNGEQSGFRPLRESS